jgi:esterase/lipase superfamily enzyme
MITNRNISNVGPGTKIAGLSCWVRDTPGLDQWNADWRKVTLPQFRTLLAGEAGDFPLISEDHKNAEQQHVTLFIHGYNNDFEDAANRYEKICRDLYGDVEGLGKCVLFTWPSNGSALGYLPDREDARNSAPHLAEVLNALYDWLIDKQSAAAADPTKACRAKTSILAHSMGNYVLQCAMNYCWTHNNRPLLVSLINQLVMIAADVDNDLFDNGDQVSKGEGEGIANLTYRVTALYSPKDDVLGASAGLKHFGKRRLGRSGFDQHCVLPDNVWGMDCTPLFAAGSGDVHSAYFESPRVYALIKDILRGRDRTLVTSEWVPGGQGVLVP